jgi:ubiquinone biosynthesis protein COQ4
MIMYEDVHPEITKPDQYSWLARHLANLHDVWHVLIGYGANHMGEISLLSFLYAQMKNKSYLYMIIAASIKTFMMKNKKHPYLRMFLEGYINGKKAKWLLSEDYEKMMGEQLDDVRKRLNIREPKIYLQLDARLKKNRKVELAC